MPPPEPLPEKLTIGEAYDPAMKIMNADDASAYFERQMTRFGRTRAHAEEIERSNIGYYAGYFDEATRRRVRELFTASHPIFGDDFAPSAVKALAAGIALGEKSRDAGC